MSNTLFQGTINTPVRNPRLIAFSFAPQGAGVPKIITGTGIKSITRTGVGAYTVNFQNTYRFLIDAQLTISMNALTALYVIWTGINVKASGALKKSATIAVFTTSTGAATEVAANANNIIYGNIYCQNA